MTTPADDTMSAHGDVSCVDAEAILAETIAENEMLREQNDLYAQTDAARQTELDLLRQEAAQNRALLGTLQKQNSHLADAGSSASDQVQMLAEELQAAEDALGEALRHSVPADSMVYAAIGQAEVVALYRQVSKVARGPLPPSVLADIEAALPGIREAMEAAGREALEKTVRAAVRRRLRAQSPGKTSSKAAGKAGSKRAPVRRVAGASAGRSRAGDAAVESPLPSPTAAA